MYQRLDVSGKGVRLMQADAKTSQAVLPKGLLVQHDLEHNVLAHERQKVALFDPERLKIRSLVHDELALWFIVQNVRSIVEMIAQLLPRAGERVASVERLN